CPLASLTHLPSHWPSGLFWLRGCSAAPFQSRLKLEQPQRRIVSTVPSQRFRFIFAIFAFFRVNLFVPVSSRLVCHAMRREAKRGLAPPTRPTQLPALLRDLDVSEPDRRSRFDPSTYHKVPTVGFPFPLASNRRPGQPDYLHAPRRVAVSVSGFFRQM